MEYNYLKNILNNLIRRLKHRNLPHDYELKRQLCYLNDNEKRLIENKIKNCPYDIGTFSVIKILRSANILSINDYLQVVNDEYEQLQIITDLLDDSINSIDLLAEMLESNKFQSQIEQALINYVEDLINHPELINLKTEMILSTQKSLPINVFLNSILKKFLVHIIHYEDQIQDLTQVISNQKEWNNQFKNHTLLSSIFQTVVKAHSQFIINELMSAVTDKVNWFYLIFILNYLEEDHAGYNEMKEFIKINFKNFKATNDHNSLCKSIILSRQLFHYSRKESTYKAWVRSNFGDLKYSLKETKFSDLLESLQNLVVYENDLSVINIHISCQISAPSKMYSTVLEYKEILKSKQEILQNKMDVS